MGDELTAKTDLQKEEEQAYKQWQAEEDAYPIPAQLAAGMYELYLNSYSCTDIWKVNAQRYPLGQIVDAKIRYEWDKRRDMQLASLFNNIEKKVLVTKNEALSHLSDMLAAAHKVWRERLMKFIQEGDPNALQGLDFYSIKNYKEILQLFNAMTGNSTPANQEKPKVQVDGVVKHVHSVQEKDSKKKVKNSADASEILKIIENAEIIDG